MFSKAIVPLICLLCSAYRSAAGAAQAGVATSMCHPKIVASEIVATHEQRKRAGAIAEPHGIVGPTGFDWSDTQLGAVRSRDGRTVLFFGSDGSCHANCGKRNERDGSITRTAGSFDDPLGSASPFETILPQSPEFQRDAIVYVGGGPVMRVPAGHPGAGNLLLVYTAARYADPEKQDGMYDYIGLAKSEDDGYSWTDLGLVLSANQRFRPGAPASYNEYDEGLGNLVSDPAAEYFYLYFPDKVTKGGFGGSHFTFLSVARVSMDALLHAAFDRTIPNALPFFRKYYRGAWEQPGLGGISTSILNPHSIAGDPNVAWSTYLKRFVLIFDDTLTISYTESGDGIHWAPAVPLISASGNVASLLYAIPIGDRPDSAVVGRRFAIYYTYYPTPNQNGGGWIDASVRRIDIGCGGRD